MKKFTARTTRGNVLPRFGALFTAAAASAAFVLGPAGAGAQTVTPTNITTGPVICTGGSQTNTVQICLPPGTTIDKVDVFLLFDDTGSFASFVPTVTNIFSGLVSSLEAALPGVSFGFGVGRFDDYGGPGTGFSSENTTGRPFTLNQPVVTAATAGSAAARNALINAGLSHTTPGFGGDGPESAIAEGLFQVATGLGFDGNGNGNTTDSGAAGALATQTSPGVSGDVPAFSSNVLPTSGTLGGAGFRSGALHLVILATDICPVAAFPAGSPVPANITNGFGTAIPRTALSCSATLGLDRFGFVSDSKTLAGNTVANAVAPAGAGTVQGTVNALNALGIRVMGMGPGAAPTSSTTASSAPSTWLSAMARLTGAVDGSANPLVFSTSVSLAALTAAIVNSISNTTTLPVTITLSASPGLPLGLCGSFSPNVVSNVAPGNCAAFQLILNGCGPSPNGSFNLNFVTVPSGSILGSIPVTTICPSNVNHPPSASCQGTIIVSADPSTCTASTNVDNGSSDPDAGDTITVTQVPPGPYPIGTNIVTLVVTDNHGASNSCTATVFVVDSTAPDIHCPTNIVVANDPGQCSAVVTYTVTASDACSGSPVNVNVYSGHSTSGGGAPYSGLVGSFGSSGVSFATDTGYNWHPFGLGDFGADITGCLNVAGDGTYSFSLNSDDGSLLYIDSNLVVDNGGSHAPNVASGNATLVAGLHTFEVQFFEDFGGESGVDLGLPAGVSYASCGLAVTCDPPSGSTFPKGDTTVTCCAVDAAGNTNCCSFTVTVEDKEAPLASCREAVNPAGKKIPTAGKNPKSGQNPDGFYQLLGKDNCDENPTIYVKDSISGVLFGPFANGDIVKIVQSHHDTIKPGAGVVVAQIQLIGDALVYAVDADGNVGASVSCLVPKPPK